MPDGTSSGERGVYLSLRFIYIGVVVGIVALLVVLGLTEPTIEPATPGTGVRMRRSPMSPTLAIGTSLRLFVLQWFTWFACVVASPLYVWLVRRFPMARDRWGRGLAVHFGVTTAIVVLTSVAWSRLAGQWFGFAPPFDLGSFLSLRYLTDSLPFWAMIAVIHALELHRRSREHEVESAQLRAQLAESRLQALHSQLHPHFLFNTLQGISTLMHRDVKTADAMLSRLSNLLRRTLQRGDQEVALDEEIDMLSDYVAIARERFQDRVVFDLEISDAARGALVPFFVLQPLVENAIEHGVARRGGDGRVAVRAQRRGPQLVLHVIDDGPGPAEGERREGIGLSNTRERLEQLYGSAQSMDLESPPEGGFRVTITIPYRETASEPEHVDVT